MAQFARPSADVAAGAWTTQIGGTTNLYATIDESTASDADYIQSSASPATPDIAKVALSSLTDPVSSSGHIVRFRYQKSVSGGDVIDLTVRLQQGATEIASWTYPDIANGFTDGAETLTAGEADAITDYGDLDLWFEAVVGSTGPDPGDPIANDTFTDTDGTSLYSHTPDSGGTWTKHASSTMPDVHRIASNRVHGQVETGWAISYHSVTPETADQDITIAFRCVTNNNHSLYAAARIATGTGTAYLYGYQGNADAWRMYKIVAGTLTQIGSDFSESLNSDSDHTLRLVVDGNSLKGYADGVLRVDEVDNDITDAGKVGFYMEAPGSSTTGQHADAWTAVYA